MYRDELDRVMVEPEDPARGLRILRSSANSECGVVNCNKCERELNDVKQINVMLLA